MILHLNKNIYTIPFTISSGSIELIKWIAMFSMTIDHANRFFYNSSLYAAYCFGRLAMPLFAFIFAYNLVYQNKQVNTLYFTYCKRLLIFGFLATPGYIVMRHLHSVWPLNIMFMFFCSAIILYFYYEKNSLGRLAAIFIFLIAGLFVEYSWIGLLFCVSSYFFCRTHSVRGMMGVLFAYWLLDLLNGNNWALVSIIIIALATQINLSIPRIPYLFYIYYPAHLTLFWIITKINFYGLS